MVQPWANYCAAQGSPISADGFTRAVSCHQTHTEVVALPPFLLCRAAHLLSTFGSAEAIYSSCARYRSRPCKVGCERRLRLDSPYLALEETFGLRHCWRDRKAGESHFEALSGETRHRFIAGRLACDIFARSLVSESLLFGWIHLKSFDQKKLGFKQKSFGILLPSPNAKPLGPTQQCRSSRVICCLWPSSRKCL